LWAALGLAALGGCHRDAAAIGGDPGPDGQTGGTLVRSGPDAAPLVVRAAEAAPHVDPFPPHTVAPLSAREKVGESIFFDKTLSDPPGTSCASCHDPAIAFSGDNGSSTGVAQGSRPGHFARRHTPSVLYLKYAPPFHFALEDDDDVEESPFGGLTWNGRADSVAEFVRLPLFDADEMNNKNEAEVASKLRAAPYAGDLAREYPQALETTASAMKALGEALQAFLTSEAMSPFTSKFDDYLRGRAQLSPLEMKGLKAFESREKGACQHCHLLYESWNRPEGSLFTTYGYDAVGAPRNRAIAANADPKRFDLGLCERKSEFVAMATNSPAARKNEGSKSAGDAGGAKKSRSSDPKWCGFFRIPSLRNVAVRRRYMHNGVFSTLRETVAFYATRGTNPERWYPLGTPFDDVPDAYRPNVNTLALPYNRHKGDAPALDEGEIDAIVAFLETLTDARFLSPAP
jgi:cytochrome c peroxidase